MRSNEGAGLVPLDSVLTEVRKVTNMPTLK